MKGELHLLQADAKVNKHTIFVDSEEALSNFRPELHFNTTKELVDSNIMDVSAQALTKPLQIDGDSSVLKHKYNRLAEHMEKDRKLTKLMLKIGYDKNVLGKDRSQIKKHKGKKIHKFFVERKK